MKESDFWKCTPRKLSVLSKVHIKANGGDTEEQPTDSKGQKVVKGYIDQVL
jgi:hypothetical protein